MHARTYNMPNRCNFRLLHLGNNEIKTLISLDNIYKLGIFIAHTKQKQRNVRRVRGHLPSQMVRQKLNCLAATASGAGQQFVIFTIIIIHI